MSDSENSDTETPDTAPKNHPNPMIFPTEFAAQFAEFLKQSLRIPDKADSSSTTEPPSNGIGSGLAATDRTRPPPQSNSASNRTWNSRKGDEDKSKLTCSHCGGKKHTRDGCFLRIGFPEWWDDMKKARAARNRNAGGRAAVAVSDQPWNHGGQMVTQGGAPTAARAWAGGGGSQSWFQGGQMAAPGVWAGGENRASNAGDAPAGSIGPPPPEIEMPRRRGDRPWRLGL